MQRRFFEEQGPILDFEELGHAIVRHVNARVQEERKHGQLTGNRLLGLAWELNAVNASYVGRSIKHRENAMRGSNERDSAGYSGKIWFRLENELHNGFDALFYGSMFHIGTGGYSTWEGPWQELGKEIYKLEVGVPWELRQKFAAYTFSGQFYLSDFPDLDQFAIMQKLSDEPMPAVLKFLWQEDGLEERDQFYLNQLKTFQEKAHG